VLGPPSLAAPAGPGRDARTKRPATGSCGLRLQSPLAGAAINRPGGFASGGRSFQLPAAPGPNAPRPRPPPVGGSRTKRPATRSCGLHLPSPLTEAGRNRPGGFAGEGRSFQRPAVSTPNALRPRPSSVGGDRTKRPATGRCGLRLQSPLTGAGGNRPGGFASGGRSFQLPAVSGPTPLGRGHHPWVEAAQNARQLDVAGFVCKAPSRGLVGTAPGGFASGGRSFQLPAVPGPPPFGCARRVGREIAQNARQLDVAGFICKAPSRGLAGTALAVSQVKAAVFNGRPYRGQRPRPRPSPVGGSRTKRPATGRCGLRLPSPLAGATPNRPGGFASEGRSFQLPAASGPIAPWPRPSSVGGSRTERPATGRCGLRLQSPLTGAGGNRPGGFAGEGRSFQRPAVSRPTPLGRGHHPWVEAAQNARQLEVAGFICKAP